MSLPPHEMRVIGRFIEGIPDLLPGVRNAFLMGSLRRGTHLRGLHDVDVCVVLEDDFWRATRRRGPAALLQRVRDLVRATDSSREVVLQNRSIALRWSEPPRVCDLVPAFRHPWKTGVYEIPDIARDAWIATSPGAHIAFNRAANRRTEGLANVVIRSLKARNLLEGKPLRSFHIEVVACASLRTPVTVAHGERLVLERLANAIRAPLPDPAGVGPAVDDGYSDDRRSRAERALRESLLPSLDVGRASELARWNAA